MRLGAILVAGGRGERFGGSVPKGFVELDGEPLFAWSLATLHRLPGVDAVVLVAPGDLAPELCAAWEKRRRPSDARVAGGPRRQDSVARGLEALSPDVELVVVHDAARPLATLDLFRRTVETAARHGAALAATPVSDTVKQADADGVVVATRSREGLWLAETPQVFRRDWLVEAHERAGAEGVEATDDAALVEALGRPVRVVRSDGANPKITWPEDLLRASALRRLLD